ncbi:cyclic nucleotide-binding domain-containing protein, partial [Endomicrobium sp. AH-315-J14]|nr:cyclic nucleotide-binding domain-containing protein [Endomicrobium sp. AH-315-J14]
SKRSLEARLAIIRLAGASKHAPVAVDLLAALDSPDAKVSHGAMRSLARLRHHVSFEVDEEQIERTAKRQLLGAYRDLLFLGRGSWVRARDPRDGESPIQRVVREEADSRLARVFRLLGLLYPNGDIQSAFHGMQSPLKAIRAKSVEFLDNVVSGDLKELVLPLLDDADAKLFAGEAKRVAQLDPDTHEESLRHYLSARERWVKAIAAHSVGTEKLAKLGGRLRQIAAESDAELRHIAERTLSQLDGNTKEATMALTVVEMALKLRTVDVLERASSEDLGHIAQIAEEVLLEEGETIYTDGDVPDALYLVVSGSIRLATGDVELGTLESGEAFGTWALFDDAPRTASATTAQATTLLKVNRDEFLEVLADRPDIAQAVFKAMVKRIRSLAGLTGGP